MRYAISIALLVSLLACDKQTEHDIQTGVLSIPESEQREGDPDKGRLALITEPIVSCGLPYSVYKKLPERETSTLPFDRGPASNLPYDLNLIRASNGVELVASNCLSCHAAPLFGELVIGLGNEFLDFTGNASQALEPSGALVTDKHEIVEWEKYADRIAAIAPYMQTKTAGVNPANNLTFALMAHRDRTTLAWSDELQMVPPATNVPPVSVPPWWRMSKKHAMFWMGEGRGDHATIMMSAAILCTDSEEELQQLDNIAADVRAYISSLQSPAYPFPVDRALAARGEVVFNDTCSQCHGTYGDSASYPNRIVRQDVIGTDPALIDFAFGAGAPFVEWFNESVFGRTAQAVPSRGYVAPPLDGIWSTAPYLHNGSVPTIRSLLHSATRPSVWRHRVTNTDSKENYNQLDLGWFFLEQKQLESLQLGLSSVDKWVYDTSVPGYSNAGHLFGDALTDDQRDAVLEYIKTL
jgi:mono/diheme cytochrome c family protein